ncbi:methionine biosynthesis protein MetW [Saccharophagus degradans]|uniref:Methionine biosynthesis protein MetW n=1 Tax=Saccharophagus degradans TaxID=86304 RepID=A0AAW7X7U9_9GAMM|nr:methionine biosynthesis protein MetW [Saccharophagus degradans]MDO6423549.1 methionine biosynthesis protein MetW [Saccharophagus degradans]MDO6607779.1 methionine biosynthesis protein MetW [Saccharophagus degradans]
MRTDHEVIAKWIKPDSHILDLGCGDGSLLRTLQDEKNVHGYGLEISAENILRCVENGINVVEQNVDDGLSNFEDQSFDTVIMSQAIQTLRNPDKVLLEMLRVGRQAVITFPNFGHWRARYHLLVKGRMPVSDLLPYEWYNTPNIHFCTFKDFEILCHELNLNVLNREVVAGGSQAGKIKYLLPNLLGETALYRVTKHV